MTHLADHGYVVIRGVADAGEVEAATSLFWDDIEDLYAISRSDSDTWSAWAVDERGLMAGLTQSAGAWAIRGLPKLRQAYARIWGEDDLLVSMDVVLLWRPWRVMKACRPVTEGFHLDQNPFSKPHRVCVQGMVPLIAVTEETGGLHVVPDSHLDAAKAEWKRRYPKYDMYVVSGAIGDFAKCNGLYHYDGLLNGKKAYANARGGSTIYFDGQWKMSAGVHGGQLPNSTAHKERYGQAEDRIALQLALSESHEPSDGQSETPSEAADIRAELPREDTKVCSYYINSVEDEPPAGDWVAFDTSHVCQVQKGKAGGDWCPCDDPCDPSPQMAKLLLAEPGDLILWDARTVHGGQLGTGVLPPPPGTPAKLARLSLAVNMTPRAWASEKALQSRRDAWRDGVNMTMYPHEVGAADGTVRDVLLGGGRSEPVRWARRAVLSAAQAALVPLAAD